MKTEHWGRKKHLLILCNPTMKHGNVWTMRTQRSQVTKNSSASSSVLLMRKDKVWMTEAWLRAVGQHRPVLNDWIAGCQMPSASYRRAVEPSLGAWASGGITVGPSCLSVLTPLLPAFLWEKQLTTDPLVTDTGFCMSVVSEHRSHGCLLQVPPQDNVKQEKAESAHMEMRSDFYSALFFIFIFLQGQMCTWISAMQALPNLPDCKHNHAANREANLLPWDDRCCCTAGTCSSQSQQGFTSFISTCLTLLALAVKNMD